MNAETGMWRALVSFTSFISAIHVLKPNTHTGYCFNNQQGAQWHYSATPDMHVEGAAATKSVNASTNLKSVALVSSW